MHSNRLARLTGAAVTGAALVASIGTAASAAVPASTTPFSRSAGTAATSHVAVNFTFYNPNGTNNGTPDLYFIGVDATSAPTTTFKVDWGDGTASWSQVGGGQAGYVGSTPVWSVSVPTHAYTTPGIYTATASVDDGTAGGAASATAAFAAHYAHSPTAPQVSFDAEAGEAPLAVAVTISGGTVDPSATVKNYVVNWGDGGAAETVAAPASGDVTVHHTYTVPNTYQYFWVATNDGVDNSPMATATVTAYGLAMTATVGPDGGVTANVVSGAGKPLAMSNYYLVDIDWGDGSAPSKYRSIPDSVRHLYASAGSYKITGTMYPTTVPEGQSPSAYTWTATATVQAPAPKGPPPPPTGSRPVRRLGDQERIGTGIAVSQARWSSWKSTYNLPGRVPANSVVLARSDGFADALAGVPLAAHDKGPLLLTDSKTLSLAVEREISRVLQPGANKTVYLLGGDNAISPAVATRLVQLGYNVKRYAGSDRFGTALDIARRGLGDPAKVVVATGLDYPDALSAGPYASAVLGAPGHEAAVVLSQGPVLDPMTAAYLAPRLASSTATAPTVVTVGGAAGKAVDAAFPGQAGHELQLTGGDRYKTAAMVAARFPTASAIGVATGAGYADALTGGAFAAAQGFPIVLTDPSGLNPDARSVFARFWSQLGQAYLFGGTSALGDQVQRDVDAVLNSPSQP
ncbi:MAG: hypothetical protein HOV83_16530 [Catenulispora sp.]|nr:hypothetical protein [Catenulispora sp.]